MAKYGAFLYRGGYYGEIPRLPFSVEPFQAVAVDYDKVLLSWGPPQGAINGLRLVRNQVGFGEWPEDGVVLFEKNSDTGDFGDNLYVDGEDNLSDDDPLNDIPLTPGRFVYYRMWIRRSSTNLWVAAESTVVVLPSEHATLGPDGQNLFGTHEATLNLFPRIFTSASGEPYDPVSFDTDLSKFLEAFSFSYDEFLTLCDLLLPDYSGRSTNPALLGLQTRELGLNQEDSEFVIRQKRMVRESIYMYSRKGTEKAINALVESLTGFAPEITTGSNLLLSNQDSTFNESVGNWRFFGDGSFNYAAEIRPPSGEDKAIENDYSAKAIINSPGAFISNGDVKTITRGIPIDSGTDYTFSFFAQSSNAVELVEVEPTIRWYGSGGNFISSVTGNNDESTISWAKYSVDAQAPGKSFLITDYSVTSSVVTITTDETHNVTAGQEISVLGIGVPYDGEHTVDSVTSDTITYTITEVVASDSGSGLEGAVKIEEAFYASIEIKFNSVGTVYLDLVQFADSSVTDFNEARSVDIFLNPSKSNFLKNPNFSGTTFQWEITGGSESYVSPTAPYLYSGDTMLQIDCGGGALQVSDDTTTGGMPSGRFYTFSTYAQCSAGTEDIYLEFVANDFNSSPVTFTGEATTVDSEWTRISVTGYVPDELVSDTMKFFVYIKIDSADVNSVVNFEAAQLETSFEPSLYIDGSFPPEYGIVWEGATDNSRSHLYKNKQQKIIRLIQELEEFLPSNTPYVVESFGGIETKAITF